MGFSHQVAQTSGGSAQEDSGDAQISNSRAQREASTLTAQRLGI